MEASPSNATTIEGIMAEESGLEDLWSELYALKNLYRFLHIASGDDSRDCLDEKSRDVLKKLLDGATNQALQSQAKIICYTPEPPQTLEKLENARGPVASTAENTEPKISTEEEVKTPEELRRCTPISSKQETAESTQSNNPPTKAMTKQPKREPELLQKTEPKFTCKRCPGVNRRGALSRQNSSTVSDKRLALRHPHHQDRESSKPRTGNRINKKKQANVVNARSQDERGFVEGWRFEIDGVLEGELDDSDEGMEGEGRGRGRGRVEDGYVAVSRCQLVAELGGGKEVAWVWKWDYYDFGRRHCLQILKLSRGGLANLEKFDLWVDEFM
ncbi:uncharacterized protein LOC109838384 [Asparagus officinalis]|uniref:uncharacterized protein LOC109838384 n=1 Tax=Asparagus officinalis TaxID=4686 RepID=UPI00098E27E3|nr:uncharacterized protein LOC109838384 [Asparagus officinalis]